MQWDFNAALIKSQGKRMMTNFYIKIEVIIITIYLLQDEKTVV